MVTRDDMSNHPMCTNCMEPVDFKKDEMCSTCGKPLSMSQKDWELTRKLIDTAYVRLYWSTGSHSGITIYQKIRAERDRYSILNAQMYEIAMVLGTSSKAHLLALGEARQSKDALHRLYTEKRKQERISS